LGAAVPLGGAAASLDDLLELQQESRCWFWQAPLNAAACLVSLIEKTAGEPPAKQKIINAIASH
jgi:hypothetical protein